MILQKHSISICLLPKPGDLLDVVRREPTNTPQENNIFNNMHENISSPENLDEYICNNDMNDDQMEDLVYVSDDNVSNCSSQKSTSINSSNSCTQDENVESVEIISISLIKTVTEIAEVTQIETEQIFSFTGCAEPQNIDWNDFFRYMQDQIY